MTYDQLVVFPDFTARPEDDTIYFDNVFGQAEYLSLDENSKSSVKVFPNPTSDIVNLTTEFPVEEIKIMDITGKLIHTSTNEQSVNLSSYNSGVYFLKVTQNGKISTHKVIKE